MKIIIDTSILIDHLRGGHMGFRLIEIQKKENAELFIPTIVIYELFAGKSSKISSVRKEISDTIRSFKRVDLTESIAECAGELVRDIGKHIQAQDYIIASSALEIRAEVLTLNKKHFEQIPNLKIYPL